MVYFQLKDKSVAALDKMIGDCRKYLTEHPGTVFFGVGTRVPDLTRDVNDREFDVALQVIFESRAAHDAYQEHERHTQFIAENKANWQQVRVFDADLF